MCPYTLTHNKMLASTMQHSTHNHTPTPQPPPHPPRQLHRRCVRRSGQKRPPRTHPKPGCPLRTQQCAEQVLQNWPSCSTQPHPPPTHKRAQTAVQAWNSSERRPTNLQSLQAPHPTVRLLRKEVIQPHLPVRLPCYDFVPIASPTFDNSLPQAG
jgi:hypothetical protein